MSETRSDYDQWEDELAEGDIEVLQGIVRSLLVMRTVDSLGEALLDQISWIHLVGTDDDESEAGE